MRWDDLQLLHLIDASESSGQTAPLMNGDGLMQAAGQGRGLDATRDAGSFAREMLLAREAGYVVWAEYDRRGLQPTNPATHPHQWLQEIRDLRLTLAGRDRARGRVIQRPLPDPDEDDDRPVTGMTLEEIAREIGDTYTGTQLPRYLRDSGVPEAFIPAEFTGSKWIYVLGVLEALHDGGSAARRALREFVGGWLQGLHHTPPRTEVRERITVLLAAQGWHVRDGRIVIGERTSDLAEDVLPAGHDARVEALHADVREVANRYLESGHPEVAIFEAFKAVNNRVKAMTGLDLDGSKLMGEAFADSGRPLSLADLSTETGRSIQAGFRLLFMGAVRGIRNPDAHEQFRALDAEEALEALAFASMLMRRLDTAHLKS
jgi:uncharacterized protein (TIGR02391 family)